MLALRSFTRALPRASVRIAPVRAVQRPIAISRSSILSRTTPYKSFSTTRIWREAAGDSDIELSAKLAQEYSLESDASKPENNNLAELEEFFADASFKIQDQPGTENIILTKKFGNETIKIEVSVADMNQEREMDELDEDSAMADEEDLEALTSGGKRTINQTRGGKVDVLPEDSLAPADRDVDGDEPKESEAFTMNLSITIDKGAIGATNVLATVDNGQIEINYVHFYPRAELIDPKTAEAVKEAQNVYGGPPFPYLDEELQAMYEVYIGERGINTQLVYFLAKYVEYKEQREYMQWLENMRKFVDA